MSAAGSPTRLRVLGCLLLLSGAGATMTALAQSSGGGYVLRSARASGGGSSSAATLQVNGTLAQVDGSERMSGATISVVGGFQRARAAPGDVLFANGFDP